MAFKCKHDKILLTNTGDYVHYCEKMKIYPIIDNCDKCPYSPYWVI